MPVNKRVQDLLTGALFKRGEMRVTSPLVPASAKVDAVGDGGYCSLTGKENRITRNITNNVHAE